MSTTQMKNNKEDTILEEEENGFYCFHCKKELHEKPWIIVDYPEDNYTVYGCGYLCSTNLKFHLGTGYWKNVINKEDFPGPRPVSKFYIKKDITANFGIEVIQAEIKEEEERVAKIENEYNYSSDEEDYIFDQ